VDDQTASACEPLIDRFKQQDIATLVGSRSNGSMLSGSTFRINENYTAFLPIADYQTAEGYRIDQVGVEPDIEVNPQEALDYVLENLIQKSN
jgi:C-terminal processing protease CtpA/Prc